MIAGKSSCDCEVLRPTSFELMDAFGAREIGRDAKVLIKPNLPGRPVIDAPKCVACDNWAQSRPAKATERKTDRIALHEDACMGCLR